MVYGLLGGLLGSVAIGLIRYLSPASRRQRERLGGRHEAFRFQRAWAKGKVPSGIDRAAWQRELELWPPTDLRERQRRGIRMMTVLLLGGAAAITAMAAADADGDPGAIRAVLPLLLIVGLVVVAMRFIPDQQEAATRRTVRLREALDSGPAEGPDHPLA